MTNDETKEQDIDDDDDGALLEFPRPGATLDRGRIVLQQHLRGRLWAGRTEQHAVLIAHKRVPYAQHQSVVDSLYRFDAPGVATLEYLGYPDEGGAEVALVERLPAGSTLFDLAPLTLPEVVRCGIGLCDAVLAWGERRQSLIAGLRPETVYMACGGYAGAVPRIGLFASDLEEATFESVGYNAPSDNAPLAISVDDAGFIAAQVLWFALLREHPYKCTGALNESENIWHDRRRPFSGPAELGRILEAVLVADPTKRLGVREFRDQLAKLPVAL